MHPENKLFLETSRHHLLNLRAGAAKGLQIPRAVQVMREEFQENYQPVDETSFDSILRLFEDLYKKYDEFLKTPEPEKEKGKARFGQIIPELRFIEPERNSISWR